MMHVDLAKPYEQTVGSVLVTYNMVRTIRLPLNLRRAHDLVRTSRHERLLVHTVHISSGVKVGWAWL